MAGTIEKGITITFRGDTTAFNESVKQVNSELKGVKSELSLLNRELRLDPNNLEKLSQKMDTLKEKEKLLKEEINAYQDAMRQLDPTSEAFAQAEKKCRNLEIELKRTTNEIREMGGNKVGLSLKTLGSQLDGVGGKLKSVGQSMAGASAVASGLLASFGGLALKTANYADEINTLSKTTQLSTDTLQVFGQVADLIDVDLNTMAKSAQYVAKNMDTTKAQDAYKKLGVSVKDSNGNFRDSESVMFEAIKSLQGIENETLRTQMATDLFGKAGASLGPIINDASVDIDELTQKVKENGAILSEDELNALNDVQDNLDTFKMKLGGVGTKLASDFSEPLGKATDKLVELADKVSEFVGSLSTEQKEKLLIIIGIIAGVPPLLIILGSTISAVGTIISGVSAAITFLSGPVGLAIVGITALVAVGVLLWKNWDKIVAKAKEMWEQFKQTEFVQKLIGFFEKMKEILDKVGAKIKEVVEWFGKLFGKVGDFFKKGFDKIGSFFGGSGGFGNVGVYASGGYGALELNTTINVNNNGSNLTRYQAQQFGRQIVEYVNGELGRRI